MNRTLSLLLTFIVLIALTACDDLVSAEPSALSAEPTVIGAPEAVVADASPVAGLQLFIDNPPYAEISEDTINQDGSYRLVSSYDGMVTLTFERLAPVGRAEEDIKAQFSKLSPEASDFMVESDGALSKRLSLSAWRVSYETGENEDTRLHVDVYLQADAWDYHFGASTPIDWYEEYESDISRWIDGLYLAETSREG